MVSHFIWSHFHLQWNWQADVLQGDIRMEDTGEYPCILCNRRYHFQQNATVNLFIYFAKAILFAAWDFLVPTSHNHFLKHKRYQPRSEHLHKWRMRVHMTWREMQCDHYIWPLCQPGDKWWNVSTPYIMKFMPLIKTWEHRQHLCNFTDSDCRVAALMKGGEDRNQEDSWK